MSALFVRLRRSTLQFWFPPAIMTLCALVLAELGTRVSLSDADATGTSWLYDGGVEGSRSILSAVAGSSIAVGGTAFSITIAALSYAAGTMGPRLLQSFTEDRGNQVTLGVFLSTFVFSLYSLRSVTGAQSGDTEPFIPQYNVTFALFLAIVCVGALVYFFNHVTASINTTQVVNLLADDLAATLESTTEAATHSDHTTPPLPESAWQYADTFSAPRGGYLQLVDITALTALADDADVVVRVLARPGDHICPGQVIAQALPQLPDHLDTHLMIGRSRTTEQDVDYAVRLLVEVGTRALSPGTNDPFTAMDVVDQLGSALCTLGDKPLPSGVHTIDGRLRLVAVPCRYSDLVDAMLNMLRQYGATAPAVAIHLLYTLATVITVITDEHRTAVLTRHATRVHADALAATINIDDRRAIERHYRDALHAGLPSAT